MTATARMLEADRQAQWRERIEQGGPVRQYETAWVIEKMRKYLPPEHVKTARAVRNIAARAAGIALAASERVDSACGFDLAAISKLDAATLLAGYHGAVTARVGAGGSRCLYSIQTEQTLAQTIRHCGYAAGSDRSVRQLIQLTMMAAQDYADECERQRERWRGL